MLVGNSFKKEHFSVLGGYKLLTFMSIRQRRILPCWNHTLHFYRWLPLLDPSAAELLLCSGLMSIAVLESGEMAGIYKFGGYQLTLCMYHDTGLTFVCPY